MSIYSSNEIRSYRKKFRIFSILSLILTIIILSFITFGLLYFFGYFPGLSNGFSTEISTRYGLISGRLNGDIAEFLGIPYAQKPIGSLRFNHANELDIKFKLADKDGLPYQAINYKPACLQRDKFSSELIGNEDCLYLNIFVPRNSGKAPVVFILNGLFFSFGYSNMPGMEVTPEIVTATKAIHVTLNYRMGPMSSLVNSKTNETNFGLSDILVALKWINMNIANFGGNPSNVLLYGAGSGSTLALALYNSKHSANLFHKMWLCSPALKVTSYRTDVLKYQNIQLTNEIVDENFDISEIFQSYSWLNVSEYFQMSWFHFPVNYKPLHPLHFLTIDENFLTETLLLKPYPKRNIPLIIGNTAHEVDLFPYPDNLNLWNGEFYQRYLIENLLNLKKPEFPTSESITQELSKYYMFSNSPPLDKLRGIFTGALTDLRSICPINYHLKSLLNSQIIYRYILTDSHRKFDAYYLQHSSENAYYTWDSILYLQAYRNLPSYGQWGQQELRMSQLLHRLMRQFIYHDYIEDMQQSTQSYIRINSLTDGKIDRACFMKTNECNFWQNLFRNVTDNQWNIP